MENSSATTSTRDQRRLLDQIFYIDAIVSISFGIITLVLPHIFVTQFGGEYNHSVHETLRLYACLRITIGYILWHVRNIDDGYFRRHLCEILFICYIIQAIVVLRAQMTDRHIMINWIAIILLTIFSIMYGYFRFRKGGNLIKVYELPSSNVHR